MKTIKSTCTLRDKEHLFSISTNSIHKSSVSQDRTGWNCILQSKLSNLPTECVYNEGSLTYSYELHKYYERFLQIIKVSRVLVLFIYLCVTGEITWCWRSRQFVNWMTQVQMWESRVGSRKCLPEVRQRSLFKGCPELAEKVWEERALEQCLPLPVPFTQP